MPQAARRRTGLVLAAPESPMIAGAVALAAGQFQPLVPAGRSSHRRVAGREHDPNARRRFGDVLTLAEAWGFAHGVESPSGRGRPHYDQLGDDCDFLTLAGDWPYRYSVEQAEGPARGIYASTT